MAKPFKYNGMRPLAQLNLFKGHLSWVREEALLDFPDYVGDMLATNPNIPPLRIAAIVKRVRRLTEDLIMASHR